MGHTHRYQFGLKKKNLVKSPSIWSRVPETGSDPPIGSGRDSGRDSSGMSTHTCGSLSMREHERALILFLIYTSYVYYFVNCVQLCLLFISQKDFFFN